MRTMKKAIIVALMGIVALSASAQQVNTLYFLENAPMRHTINPAFMPVSDGYVNFTPLGWMSLGIGNNSLTLSDVLQTRIDPVTGEVKTVTPFYPSDDPNNPDMRRQAFLKCLRNNIYVNGDVTLGLLNFGFRVKDFGYAHFGVNERIEMGMTMPKSMFEFLFDGGLTDDRTSILLSGLGVEIGRAHV